MMKLAETPLGVVMGGCLALSALLDPVRAQDAPPPPEAPRPPPAQVVPPGIPLPPPRLDVVVKKGRTKRSTSSTGRQESYQFSITVKNLETVRKLEQIHVEFYALGENVNDRRMYNLLDVKDTVIDLEPRSEKEVESDLFVIRYTANTGTKFAGYLVRVADAENNTLHLKSTSVIFEKNLEKIRGAEIGSTTSKAFRLD